MRAAAVALALTAVPAAGPVRAQPLVPFDVSGDEIRGSLTGLPGDAARGRAIVADRQRGLCLLCHTGPFPEQPFQGSLAPSLEGAGARLSEGQLRLRLVDGRRLNPATIMPSYYRIEGLDRVGRAWQGKPVLTAAQIEDVIAFLLTLQGGNGGTRQTMTRNTRGSARPEPVRPGAPGLTRREALAAGFSVVLAAPARATTESMAEAVRAFAGEAPLRPGRITLEIPPLVENGNSVPLTVKVSSPMTPADHVRRIAIFNEKNPQPNVAVFNLSPRSGRAVVSTRIRLGDSQRIMAVAELSDGSFWSEGADLVVTLPACVEN